MQKIFSQIIHEESRKNSQIFLLVNLTCSWDVGPYVRYTLSVLGSIGGNIIRENWVLILRKFEKIISNKLLLFFLSQAKNSILRSGENGIHPGNMFHLESNITDFPWIIAKVKKNWLAPCGMQKRTTIIFHFVLYNN